MVGEERVGVEHEDAVLARHVGDGLVHPILRAGEEADVGRVQERQRPLGAVVDALGVLPDRVVVRGLDHERLAAVGRAAALDLLQRVLEVVLLRLQGRSEAAQVMAAPPSYFL